MRVAARASVIARERALIDPTLSLDLISLTLFNLLMYCSNGFPKCSKKTDGCIFI